MQYSLNILTRGETIRAVASLSFLGGQDKNISSVFPHFPVVSLIFPQFFPGIFLHFFLVLVFRVGGWPTRDLKALVTSLKTMFDIILGREFRHTRGKRENKDKVLLGRVYITQSHGAGNASDCAGSHGLLKLTSSINKMKVHQNKTKIKLMD